MIISCNHLILIKHWKELVPPGSAFHISVGLNEGRMPVADHGHDFAEICWVVEGVGTHRVNGQRVRMEAGDLVFIRPSDCHGLHCRHDSIFRLENVAFPRETLDRLNATYFRNVSEWFWKTDTLPRMLHLDRPQMDELNRELEHLSRSAKDVFSIDCFCLNLFRLLGRERAHMSNLPDWLETAQRHFGNAPGDYLRGTSRFVELCARCPEHVARSMQTHCGISPSRWVNAQRLIRAARLLESTSLPVTEVAAECGFENLSYFHRLFKTRYRCSPLRYRSSLPRLM